MKIVACLSLLAALTACGTSKSSDKTPASTTPVVSVGNTLDTITTTKPTENKPSTPGQSDNNTNTTTEEPKTETKPVEQKPVEEAAKPVPESFVGFGYNTIEGNVKELCLNGGVTLDTGNSSSNVSFARYESYESFKATVLNHKSESILNQWAGSEFAKKYFSEATSESLKANYVFASSVVSGTKRFNSSDITVTMSPSNFHNKCGNAYINSAVIGGAFVASVSLDFTSQEAKENLEKETFDYAQLVQLVKSQASYDASLRTVASVEISYSQIGGGGALIPHLNTSDILKCSLDNADALQKCMNTLEKLSSYAISSEFMNSIQKNPAVFSFSLSQY